MSGDRYFIRNQNGVHFLTFTVVEWIDIFTRKGYKDIIVDALNYCCEQKGLNVYAWCIMSNHMHLLASTNEPYQLSDVMRDFKSFTAKQILKQIKDESESRREWMLERFSLAADRDKRIKHYKFWQESNHAIFIGPHDHKMWDQRVKYIHQNPVKEGIVEKAEDYVYSSVWRGKGGKGMVKLMTDEA